MEEYNESGWEGVYQSIDQDQLGDGLCTLHLGDGLRHEDSTVTQARAGGPTMQQPKISRSGNREIDGITGLPLDFNKLIHSNRYTKQRTGRNVVIPSGQIVFEYYAPVTNKFGQRITELFWEYNGMRYQALKAKDSLPLPNVANSRQGKRGRNNDVYDAISQTNESQPVMPGIERSTGRTRRRELRSTTDFSRIQHD